MPIAPPPNLPTFPNMANGYSAPIAPGAGGSLLAPNQSRQPSSFLGSVLDILGRGQYASAAFAGTLMDQGFGALGQAFINAGSELIVPKARLSFEDLIKRYNPEFAAANPWATFLLGFTADVALDPTTYLGFGLVGKGQKVIAGGEKVLTRAGSQVFGEILEKEATRIARVAGDDAADALIRRTMGTVDDFGKLLSPRASAEKQFTELLSSLPKEEADKLIRQRGLRVRFAGAEANLDPILEKIGVNSVARKAEAIAKESGLFGVFNRNAKLPEEFVALRTQVVNFNNRLGEDAVASVKALYDLPELSRKKLDDIAFKIDRERFALTDGGKRSLSEIEDLGIIRRYVDGANLKPEELSAFARFVQNNKTATELDNTLDILVEQMRQYDPALYKAVTEGAEELPLFRMGAESPVNAALNSAANAPDLYAAITAAQRTVASRRAMGQRVFKDGLEKIFGTRDINKLPKAVRDDVLFMGDSTYSHSPDTLKAPLQAYDKLMGVFRSVATAYRPAFSLKQAPSNFFQIFLRDPKIAVGFLDPRNLVEGAAIAMGRFTGKGADDIAKGITSKTVFGETITGAQWMDELLNNGVLKGTDIRGERRMMDLASDVKRAADQSLSTIAKEGAKYWNWPSMIEDFFRTTAYMNARKAGHGEKAAAKLVDEALFSYTEGLSIVERQLFRRIIPFYSYQRFAIPLLVGAAINRPGAVAGLVKGQKAFLDAWAKWHTGDELTDSERRVIPDYMLSQPAAFRGFDDKQQATFNVFTNFTPLDALSIARFDKKGDLDFGATMKQVVLAQLTPALKMPIELAVDKQFFTDRAISESQRAGDIYKYMQSLPEPVRRAMDFEVALDPRSGKQIAYINPYITYTLANTLPIMSEVVRLGDEKNTALEKAMGLVFGVQTRKLDLGKEKTFRTREQRSDIEDLQDKIRLAARQGRGNMVTQYQQELQALLADITRRYSQMSGPVRSAEQ